MSEMILFKWRESVYTGSLFRVTDFRYDADGEEIGVTRGLGYISSEFPLNLNIVTTAHMLTKDSIRLQRRGI